LLPLLGVLILTSSGCIQMAALWANLSGGEVIDPEYTLTKGPLLVMIDDTRNFVTQPKAIRELHATIAENFLEFDVNRRIIPLSEFRHLRQTERKLDKMKTREIGEKLGAEQILYVWVERFTLRAEPGAPLFQGEFAVRVKVLSTERIRDVRLWPRSGSGRLCVATTKPVSEGGEVSATDVAKKLGRKLGQKIAGLFYEHREFAE
jgi:hypothetical protein